MGIERPNDWQQKLEDKQYGDITPEEATANMAAKAIKITAETPASVRIEIKKPEKAQGELFDSFPTPYSGSKS